MAWGYFFSACTKNFIANQFVFLDNLLDLFLIMNKQDTTENKPLFWTVKNEV